MSDARRNTVIVRHPVHEDVGRDELAPALDPDEQRLPTIIDIPAIRIPYGTSSIDWRAAVDAQQEQLASSYFPVLDALDSPNLVYAGRAPIPLVVHLGFRMGPFLAVNALQPHHETKSWAWDDVPYPGLRITTDGIPSEQRQTAGSVVIRVSTSYNIDPDHTRAVIPLGDTLAEIDIRTEPIGRDVLHHPESIRRVADTFREALNTVRNRLPAAARIHLFAAVPLGLAFQLGSRVQANIDRRAIVVYQFNPGGPPFYHPAVVLQENAGQPAPLTGEQREEAASLRALWRDVCTELASFSARLRKEREPSDWLAVFEQAHREAITAALPPGWCALPDAGGTDLDRAQLTDEPLLGDEPYAYAPREAEWAVSDDFLTGVATRLPEERDRRLAGALFLLHEGLHRSLHGLTEYTARGIGRFPKAIEAADYQADLWAVLQATELFGSPTVEFLDHAINVAIETMWSFTGVSAHLPVIEIRAVNRFLNWYWQGVQVRSETNFPRAVQTLATPPTIELSGPPVIVARGRPALSLTLHPSPDVHLTIWRRNRVLPFGSTDAAPLREIILGFAERDGDRIRRVLSGVYDSLPS